MAANVGIVGGGIAGSLAALVLRSRSPATSITVLDAGKRGVGGRFAGGRHPDSGAVFLRSAGSAQAAQLTHVLSQLEEAGVLARWEGRFGVLGSAGGGFLPRDILASTAIGQMMRRDIPGASNLGGNLAGVDFCGLLRGGEEPFYVGRSGNASVCEKICAAAGAEVLLSRKVVSVRHLSKGWEVLVQRQSSTSSPSAFSTAKPDCLAFDALILATHDARLAAQAVRTIGTEGASDSESAEQEQKHLGELASALEEQRHVPVFSWSGLFPPGTSSLLPFDAVSVPGSRIVQFMARNASKPGRPALEEGGELWTAVSTPAFAAKLLRHEGASGTSMPGDSDLGNRAALAATNLMASEVCSLFQQHMLSGVDTPRPLRAAAKRWGAGFATGSLQHGHDCITLPAWQLAIAGDFVRERNSPLEAAALSGLAAGESVGQVIGTCS